MSVPRPAAEPIDLNPVSIAAGMGSIAVLCVLAVVACACAHGVLCEMAARSEGLPLPAASGARAEGTTWISLGDPAKPPHMQFDGPPCAKAAAEIARIINAAPLTAKALLAVRAACRDPDTDTAMPSAAGELVEAALAAMGERS